MDQATERLKRYVRLLLEWNRGMSNLMSRNDESRIVERHVRESIEPAHWLKESGARRWIDFGSGGGLPALPLALVGVGDHWTLVESRRNKALFLRKCVGELSMSGVDVVIDRLENLVAAGDLRQSFDGFTSRATLPLGPTLEMASDLVAPGGRAFLWKGSGREREMRDDERWKLKWELDGLLGIGPGLIVVTRFTRKGI